MVQRMLQRLSSLLAENAKALDRPGLLHSQCRWTNNNAESINHVLKQATNWKSLKLGDLVCMLNDVMKDQYREVKRAICGEGEFFSTDEFNKFAVPRDHWYDQTDKQREKHYQKFQNSAKEMM